MRKTAIVTGSSRGIGRSVAEILASSGYNLVINSRSQEIANQIAQEISEKTGVDIIGVEADVRESSQVSNLVKQTINTFGRIDVLVNNAGVLVAKPLVETDAEEWNFVLDTNLKGVYLCARAVLPYMIRQKSGCIVNISSGAGKHGFAGLSAYCASKFGVIGFAESLAKEISLYNINVVTICPGAVATNMQKQFMTQKEYESKKRFMIQPEEVAKKVYEATNGKYRTGKTVDI